MRRFHHAALAGCACSAASPPPPPPMVSPPAFGLGDPFALHKSWETGMVPSLGEPGRPGVPYRRLDGRPSGFGWQTDVSLGDLGLNVPVPETRAGVIANAVVARLLPIRRPSTRVFLRWESSTGREPFVWRIHAPEIAQENVRRVLRDVLRDKGGYGVSIEEVPGPDYDPSTDLPGWHLRIMPPELATPEPAAMGGLGATPAQKALPGGGQPAQEEDTSLQTLYAYGPAVASALRAAYETDPNTDAEVLAARIKNLRRMKQQLPPVLWVVFDNQIAVLEAKLRGAKHNRALQMESERSTRTWRMFGYSATTVGIAVGLALTLALASTARAAQRGDFARKNPSRSRPARRTRRS